MSTNLAYKADIIGASASLLCMIHCLATPFVFFLKTSTAMCCSETPMWWQSIDYLFLTVAFFAVVHIIKNNRTQTWLKSLLIISWIGLLIVTLISFFLTLVGIMFELNQIAEYISFYFFVSAFIIWSFLSSNLKKRFEN